MVARGDLQDGAASDDGPLSRTPILPTSDKGEDHGDENIGKACVKRPHDTRTPRQLFLAVISRSCSVDLASKGVECSLKGRGILAALLQLANAALRGSRRPYLPRPERHHDGSVADRSPEWEPEL